MGVFRSGLAYVFWYSVLEHAPASRVGSFLYLRPVVTAIVAGVWLVDR